MISSLASKWQALNVGMLILDIITKFKSQGLYIIRIKYRNTSGSGSGPLLGPLLPSLILVLWNICILLHKQATLGKHSVPSIYSAHNSRGSKYEPKYSGETNRFFSDVILLVQFRILAFYRKNVTPNYSQIQIGLIFGISTIVYCSLELYCCCCSMHHRCSKKSIFCVVFAL